MLCLVSAGLSVSAQTKAEAEAAPITCWWRTNRVAVLVGERFTLTLTCRVVTTGKGSVLVDPAQFDVSTVSLIPYEIIALNHPEDLLAPRERYFQYEYAVRLIGTASFGQAVEIPSLVVTYRVQSAEDKSPSRERAYALPALPMRVLSVVGPGASDIRDVAPVSFARIGDRQRRSLIELTTGGVAFGFAAVLFVASFVRSIRVRTRRPSAARVPTLSRRAVLSACVREAKRVREEVEQGAWTGALLARACAMLRVAAAITLEQALTETVARRGERPREGQLLVRTGVIRPRHMIVSSAVTRSSIERAIAVSPPRRNSDLVACSVIADALGGLGAARFGHNVQYDEVALNDWLDRAIEAIRRSRAPGLRLARVVRRTPARSALGVR
jgi:hypothetical protein